ncbi:MAG: DNA recombination protein RmuC [Gemmatimonadota bacterium]
MPYIPLVPFLIGAGAFLVLLLLFLLFRRGSGRAAGMMEQQIAEMRNRLDLLVASQQDLPRALFEDRAAQARVLSDQVAMLSTLVTAQLETSQTTMGQRLDETGRLVSDVRERLGQLSEATQRLESMGHSVTEVQELLRVPRLRGTIGEVWLEEILRQVFPASLYQMQYTFQSGVRVDAVVRIGERLLPIDAKFPLEACQRMLSADGQNVERERRAFRKSLRERIDEIADRYISPREGTFEFALMYIPAENVYYEAIVRGEDLVEGHSIMSYAMARRVIPVSPHTFYAYLSVVLHGLKGLHVEERAQQIQAELGTLDQQFDRFWSCFEKVGSHLTNAQKQFAESERQAMKVRIQLEGMASGDVAAEPEVSEGAAEHTPLESTFHEPQSIFN